LIITYLLILDGTAETQKEFLKKKIPLFFRNPKALLIVKSVMR
jgi:hypothetical protein